MKLLSVTRAMPRAVDYKGRRVLTGIYKEPVTGPVYLHREGLEGDGQADLKVHGGPDKAAYAYPIEHYGWWQEQLGREPFPHGPSRACWSRTSASATACGSAAPCCR